MNDQLRKTGAMGLPLKNLSPLLTPPLPSSRNIGQRSKGVLVYLPVFAI